MRNNNSKGISEDIFYEICSELNSAIEDTELEGHVFAVGGCVRDIYMKHKIKDIDLAVDIPNGGLYLARLLNHKGLLSREPVIFEAYSVSNFSLKSHPDIELEAVQTRKEKYEDKSSRNPVTAFGSITEDCYRRDLTINSLYMNIKTRDILDITKMGINDIDDGIIRTPLDPEETFDDDPLRMLRVIRFASRYHFKIEEKTSDAIREMANRLCIITKERIHDELSHMMAPYRDFYMAMLLLYQHELLPYIFSNNNFLTFESFSEFDYGFDVACKRILHEDVFVKLAFIFYICGKGTLEQYEELLREMKFSNEVIKDTLAVLSHINKWSEVNTPVSLAWCRRQMYECKSERIFKSALRLYDVTHNIKFMFLCLEDNINSGREPNWADKYKLPVSGFKIMEHYGIPPGQQVKHISQRMLAYLFENPNATEEELFENIKL